MKMPRSMLDITEDSSSLQQLINGGSVVQRGINVRQTLHCSRAREHNAVESASSISQLVNASRQ